MVRVDNTVYNVINGDKFRKPISPIHFYAKSKAVDDILVEITLEKSVRSIHMPH